MKIPTSSSILLATLAMSSSSSCLIAAAPTGDGSADSGMTTASSNHHISSLLEATTYPTDLDLGEPPEAVVDRVIAYPGQLLPRDNLVNALVQTVAHIPVIGGPLGKILGSLLVAAHDPAGAKTLDTNQNGPNIDPQDMQALHRAIAELNRAVNSTAPTAAAGGNEDDNPNSHAPPPSTPPSSGTPENAASNSGVGANSASLSPVPSNPPNSPINASLPVDV